MSPFYTLEFFWVGKIYGGGGLPPPPALLVFLRPCEPICVYNYVKVNIADTWLGPVRVSHAWLTTPGLRKTA